MLSDACAIIDFEWQIYCIEGKWANYMKGWV